MTIMRRPQHGHGGRGSSDRTAVSASAAGGAASRSLARARLAHRPVLDIHHPLLASDRRQVTEERSAVAQLATGIAEAQPSGVMKLDQPGQEPPEEQRRKHVDGQQEGGSRGDPTLAIEREVLTTARATPK